MNVGLRELRQNASDLVRRVEGGEIVTVTVSGRPVADLVPVARRTWVSAKDIAELAALDPDVSWHQDTGVVDAPPSDPFAP
jgi:prevent-host-death family protein